MIDGLRLTISGEELRRLFEHRIEHHERCVKHWKREQARTPEEQTEDEPLLPRTDLRARSGASRVACGCFAIHSRSRRGRGRVPARRVGSAVRRIAAEKPWAIEQEEYEERTSIGFNLERLTKTVGEVFPRELLAAITREEEAWRPVSDVPRHGMP